MGIFTMYVLNTKHTSIFLNGFGCAKYGYNMYFIYCYTSILTILEDTASRHNDILSSTLQCVDIGLQWNATEYINTQIEWGALNKLSYIFRNKNV